VLHHLGFRLLCACMRACKQVGQAMKAYSLVKSVAKSAPCAFTCIQASSDYYLQDKHHGVPT
jgi:hypothetical protein